MSYTIRISGHTETVPIDEIAEEGRKAVKALLGVSSAMLYSTSSDGKQQIEVDLTKPQADVAAQASEEGGS